MKDQVSCAEYRTWLIECLADPAVGVGGGDFHAHAVDCDDCRVSRAEIEEGWAAFGELAAFEPPVAVKERMRSRVLHLINDERLTAKRRSWLKLGEVPLAVTSGLLVTAAMLSLLGGLIWGSALPSGHLFFCAAIFTGLTVGAFSWIYSATTVNGLHLDAAARVGLLALSITVAATTACPELHVLAWWDRSAAGQMFTRFLGAGGSSLVFGFVYGLFPGFLAALFGGKLLADRPVANGLIAVAVVFLLATPVIYLQSAPFTSGVVVSWLAGTAAGTLCGVFGALQVRQRVQLATSFG